MTPISKEHSSSEMMRAKQEILAIITAEAKVSGILTPEADKRGGSYGEIYKFLGYDRMWNPGGDIPIGGASYARGTPSQCGLTHIYSLYAADTALMQAKAMMACIKLFGSSGVFFNDTAGKANDYWGAAKSIASRTKGIHNLNSNNMVYTYTLDVVDILELYKANLPKESKNDIAVPTTKTA